MRHPLLALADVHRLTTLRSGRAIDAYVFDHHRSAFAVWCHSAREAGRPLTLVTLDRHMDLGTPGAAPPAYDAPLEALDRYARHSLAPSNDDHIVAALEAGAIGDAVVLARSHEPPSLDAFRPSFLDRNGGRHRFAFAKGPSLLSGDARALIDEAGAIALDIDLDAFTTPSDGEIDVVLRWDPETIRRWLMPPGSETWWPRVLDRTAVITLAREPYHCGGFEAGARLWIDFARIFFGELLGSDVP